MQQISWQEKGCSIISQCGLYCITPEIWPEYKAELTFASWWYRGKSRKLIGNVTVDKAKELCQNHQNWLELKMFRIKK